MWSGGTVLKEGTYGCTFTESTLQCADGTPIGTKGIVKLTQDAYATYEMTLADRVRALPGWERYYLVPERSCTPSEHQDKAARKDLKRCLLLKDVPLSEFRLLSMAHGGVDLHRYSILQPAFRFPQVVTQLLAAGALLTLHRLVHTDLHRGNVVVDSFGVCRFIDFNVSLDARSPPKESTLSSQHSLTLEQSAPDYTLVNAVAQGIDPYRVIDALFKKQKILKTMSVLLSYPLPQMKADLTHGYESSESIQTGNRVAWFRAHWHTVDSWSIGVLLVSLWNQFLVSVPDPEAWKASQPLDALRSVVRRMCELDANRRWDAVQALKQWAPSHELLRTRWATEWLASV